MNLDRKSEGPIGAVEQGEDAVARDVNDLAAIIADQRLEKLDRLRGLDRVAGLVLFEALAVLDHVGEHDSRRLS